MAISDQGTTSPPISDLGSLKAEWSRRHAHATAEALHYETLLESAREIEEIAELWQGLAASPVSHPAIRASRQEAPTDAAPGETAVELDTEKVLLLMAQEPHRLWRAKDIQAAFAHPSLTEVRCSLKALVVAGRLEAVRRKARHLLFRIAVSPSAE
ncbi:hypothetical protein ACFY15_31130 [Streptomyces sp. NPDC001373]|uniref:hypothetical protein n=1 Tax=Streptomyces sp. NPDC001373 TaxID=3364565 RepID=UPI00369C2495